MTKINRSIERGLKVLEVVYASGASSLAFLAAQTGLPKPTLVRICATLQAHRWLIRRSSDGHYQIGSAFPQSGKKTDLLDGLVAVGKEEIVRLSRDTGLGVDLAAGIGSGQTEIVDTTRVFKTHRVYPHAVGYRPSPFLSALGSAYLSALSDTRRDEALRSMSRWLSREDTAAQPRLPHILKQIAERGHATRAQGHWGRAVDYGELPAAIAVPIIGATGPVGALNLVWNADGRSVERVAEDHLARLRSAAEIIGRDYADLG